jgi:hypothetical protein
MEPFIAGASRWILMQGVGDAISESELITDRPVYTDVRADARLLEPHGYSVPLFLNTFTMAKEGYPDVEGLARQASDSAGKQIDKIIIGGLNGTVRSKSAGDITFPAGQTVPHDFALFDAGATTSSAAAVMEGLNAGKITAGVTGLKQRYAQGFTMLVSSYYGQATLMNDYKLANSLYNFNGPVGSMGELLGRYGGVDMFVACEQVPKGLPSFGGTPNTTGEYAFLYNVEYVRLGTNKEMELVGPLPELHGMKLAYNFAYGCIRLQDEAVVRIEINRPTTPIVNGFAMAQIDAGNPDAIANAIPVEKKVSKAA